MIQTATLTCPNCNFKKQEEMPENVCVGVYRCPECNTQIKAKDGDCCIYCSYADCPCASAQLIGSACCSPD